MTFTHDRLMKAQANWESTDVRKTAMAWHDFSRTIDYQYMFEFCGLPIIQDPQDVCLLQEIIWRVKPSIVIETGVARGGSLVLSAVILSALTQAEVLSAKPVRSRRVIGVDIDIRTDNRTAIQNHPLAPMITLIEGSSVDPTVVSFVKEQLRADDVVLVILDSNHTEEHVSRELECYAPMVTVGSAILVMDTGIEFAPPQSFNTVRPWGPGASPYSATKKFLASTIGEKFIVDRDIERRHLITCAPEGLLVRISK